MSLNDPLLLENDAGLESAAQKTNPRSRAFWLSTLIATGLATMLVIITAVQKGISFDINQPLGLVLTTGVLVVSFLSQQFFRSFSNSFQFFLNIYSSI
jgi:hypothetical protein